MIRSTMTQHVFAAAAIALLAACDSSTEPQQPTAWSAELAAVGASEVEGTLTISATTTSFGAEIEIENGVADTELRWQVAAGTCAEPGNRLGAAADYPFIEVGAGGTGSAEATVNAGLSPSGSYHAAVTADDEDDTVLACGDLVRAE